MRQTASTLEDFYERAIGKAAADRIGDRLRDLWGPCAGDDMLGIGYTLPLIPIWQDTARSFAAVLPGEIGASSYSGTRGGIVTRAPEDRLPFGDASFDRIVLLHALEEAENPRHLMREAWRLLAPEGRIVVATTNRRSFWSATEAQAFGYGRPWTRNQLIKYLSDSLFTVTASTTAVHMPPLDWPIITAASRSWERAGEWVLPGLGGVVLVEAAKRLYAKPGGSAPAPIAQPVKGRIGRQTLPRRDAARIGDSERQDK
ncbi:MAG: class I SAM-dependent methyltransferase [Pseudomonadota bacterium]